MARVFLSYRRADGQYAVGWIAERLATIGADPTVRVAFRDGNLRGGDDFPEALTRLVDECDILVAVVGPNWAGERPDGSRRILDPTDWVGREVASALEQGKIVMPVLIDGAEPVTTRDLPPEFASFADLNALVFDDDDDLEALVADVQAHLTELDEQRARVAGLDEPIVLSPLRPPLWVWALMVVAALAVGGLVAGLFFGLDQPAGARFWKWSVVVQLGVVSGASVVGWWYFASRVQPDVRIRWRPVGLTIGVIVALIAWGASLYGGLIEGEAGSTIGVALVTLVLLFPWVIIAVGSAWTESLVPPHAVRQRALAVAELSRAGLVSSTVLSVAAAGAVVTAVGALWRNGGTGAADLLTVITYGAFLGVLIGGVLVYGRTQLVSESLQLRAEVRDLAPAHRQRLDGVILDEPIRPRDRWILVPLLLPTVTGIVLSVVMWTGDHRLSEW